MTTQTPLIVLDPRVTHTQAQDARPTKHSLSVCPACSQPETLIALGARRDRRHRWLPWITALTQLYLCDCCDALVAAGTAQDPVVESVPHLGTGTVAAAHDLGGPHPTLSPTRSRLTAAPASAI